jgi:hypothetical protein
MAGADAVWRSAVGRASKSSKGRSTRRATVTDGSGTLVNSNRPGMHLATTGPGSAPKIPTATQEARTFRTFAPKK